MSGESPLVVIAFDAGDPGFLLRWAEEGSLPTFAGLLKRGCWGKLADPEQISEWGTWRSLLSGVSRARHGCYYFRQLVPGTYDLRLFDPRKAAAAPFWAHLHGEQARRIAVIDPPESPIVSGLEGLQLLDWATRWLPQHSVEAVGEPRELLDIAGRVFGPQISISDYSPRLDPVEDGALHRLLLERVEKKGRLVRHLLERGPVDLLVAGFYEGHDAAHRFWDYGAGSRLGAIPGAGELGGAIRDVYQAIDRQVGAILAALPDTANVFVISCYGMESMYPMGGIVDGLLPLLGYQPALVSDSFRPAHLLRRMVPHRLRVALNRRVPVAAQERLLAAAFRDATNWKQTTAFAIPSVFSGLLRVNLRGREPQGIVEESEYDGMLERLEEDFRSLVDPRTGAPVVKSITRAVPQFGDRPPEVLPDLFVEWRPNPRFVDRVEHPRGVVTQPEPGYFRSSYHSHEGLFAAAGPAIRARGQVERMDLLDLAPSFLSLLGVPTPSEMTGRPVLRYFSSSTTS